MYNLIIQNKNKDIKENIKDCCIAIDYYQYK